MPSPEPVKFLLVDDLDENLLAVEALLQRDGLVMHKARSGQEALELLLVDDFALALLDVQMPGMDGFELAELMRGTERTRRVPIIFLTAVATDERRRFRGYEAGAVDYLFKPADPDMLRQKCAVFFELERQRQELKLGGEQLAQALGRLKAHSDNSPIAIVELDPELRVTGWSKGAERSFGWTTREVLGRRADEFRWVHEDDLPAFLATLTEPVADGAVRAMHGRRCYRRDGAVLETEWYCSTLLDGGGAVASLSAQILDVTERRRSEETQQLLMGELNHRVKNMLATVQAIATQTLRHSVSPEEFTGNFASRIQSLARAHSLLSSAGNQSVELNDLIQDQLRLGADDETRLTIAGPGLRLPPQPAMHLGLILHELGTNARKYGALSSPLGQVTVGWEIENETIRLHWSERGGPKVRAPSRRGFGTSLIEQSVNAEGGAARATYAAEGVSWDITLSLPAHTSTDGRAAIGEPPRRPEVAVVPPVATKPLSGRTVLVVEDEPLVALDVAAILEDAGLVVVGPVGTAEQAFAMIAAGSIDAALLDGNLNGRPVDDVAAALTRHKIPFAFTTGYGRDSLPAPFASAPLVTKPFTDQELLRAIAMLFPDPATIVRLRN